jgi:DNA-directed RNA polymerase specialized sigma24 family protein
LSNDGARLTLQHRLQNELIEADRDAIILRFLRQQSLREVAQVLSLSEEVAKKRVSRAP